MLERYGHGGDLESATEVYGQSVFLDFSANINPLGPPPGVMQELENALPSIIRYPDPGHRGLKERLGAKLGVRSEQLCIGNGAAECMALILLGLQPHKVGIVEPCFSEYRQLSEQFGANVQSVCGTRENGWRTELSEIEGLLKTVDLLFIGQPNNPNGIQYDLGILRHLASEAERCGTYLVVDEAFIDFIPENKRQTMLPELDQYPHTILVRSMTKFYAIPGLRLGYAVAHSDLVQAMTGKQVTWSVNGLALLAGEACLNSGERYERETIELITEQRCLLVSGLRELGCEVSEGEANFLLAGLPAPWTAESMQTEMGRRGVLIRSCATYPGLGEEYIRVAVKAQESNRQLLKIMAEVLNGQ
ncbi:pyridoxal phosphate-dependent class II aminotransferase [Paenibacillus sp.]|jgi:threonine-phosphate decarboxylase|uniref:pyridoxal phosphate-dependent aminotransferase n=1 Tax=Paenibacillus sp. TaxID=58172 RepID=UPI00282D6E75|nr:pyridoxal phosphate-dependent class II aminotransferase [Paenibacillus sp.]MDR0269808.1 pyridoxal phosphate-dependent class II aminotransferase [Paenibacillus sp.]